MKNTVALIIVMIACACQHVIVPVTAENKHLEGVRFVLPEAYLFVAEKAVVVTGFETKEGDKVTTETMELSEKELVTSIIYLPNPKCEYLIKNADPEDIILKDGWRFEGFASYSHQQENEKLQIDALVKLLTGTQGLTPGIYRFLRDESGSITQIKEIILSR